MTVLSRRTRTEEIRRANEDALLSATIALLDEGSAFADLGIEQIVKRAGLSRPTFYTYFRDKRDLALKLGEALEHDLIAVTETWFGGGERSARDTLTAVLAVFARHRSALRAITEAATYDPEVAGFWQRFHDRFVPEARKRILAGNPELGDDAATARAYALVYMTERTLIEHTSRPAMADAPLIDQLTWFWESAVG